jgi:hypothetical protein
MRVAIALVVLFAAVAIAQPIRPQISETFEGEGYTHIVTINETIWGLGRWVIDEPTGHALEFWEFSTEHRHMSVHVLKRYDLGFDYGIHYERHPSPHVVCHKRAVTPPMPKAWAWLQFAHYRGKHVIDGTTFDLWGHHVGGMELEVAVSEHDASRPHYFMRRTPSDHRVYHLISWNTFKPNSTWFTVPDACKNATETLGAETSVADGDDTVVSTCGVAADHAERIVSSVNGFSAAPLLVAAFKKADITVPSSIETMRATGAACSGGARVGDVFFGASSAAVYLGGNRFAECPTAMGGSCSVVAFRDFEGGCRRFC